MRCFTTDTVPRLLYAAGLAGTIPQWALAVPIPQFDELSKLASQAFADPAHRMLPLHTKEATVCSAVYVAALSGIYPQGTEDRVKAAAVALGVGAEVDAILSVERPKQAAAAPILEKAAFALVIEDGAVYNLAAGRHDLLPCHDSYTIEHSGEELAKSASSKKLPPEMVRVAAVELTKAARAKNCLDTLPPQVIALGTERVADWSKAATLIQDRGRHVDAGWMRAYDDLVKLGSETPENAEEIIAGLRDLDAAAGLDYWGKSGSVASPWEVVYSGLAMEEIEKMATTHFVVAGALVPIPAFSALSETKITSSFSKQSSEIILGAQRSRNSGEITRALSNLEEDLQARLFNTIAAQ